MAISVDLTLFDVITEDACSESALWEEALLGKGERQLVPVFSTLVPHPGLSLGVETIYEGYLVHYGRPRLFSPDDPDTALLLGDYLYAHGLVRVASTGNVQAVRDLAELISLCAQGHADGRRVDGPAWAATAALLGMGGLDDGRVALRESGDTTMLEAAARAIAGDQAVERAFAAHERLAVR